jgi:uncharacterized heparinase superfamily protein
VLARALIRDVPAVGAPALRTFMAKAPAELQALAEKERERGLPRVARLPEGSLRDFEEAYGLELGDGSHPKGDWSTRAAVAPFPASVRARRIAVAARLGRSDLGPELARAARAVTLQIELHLLANHVLENGIGLACAGAVATGPEADAWWHLGKALISWQLPEQFLADGGHFERSASYHLALTHGLLEVVHLARAAGRGVPPGWSGVISRALAFAAAVRAPDGAYPLFNDASLDAAPSIDEVLALARAVLSMGDPQRVPHPPPGLAERRPSTAWDHEHLADTGWLLVRSADHLLALDAGPDGARYQPGHVHADALTFELWVSGVRAIADLGVAGYGVGERRERTRATRSHNTVTLGGRDSAEVWHGFRAGRLARTTLRAVTRVPGVPGGIRVEASHDGFSWMPGAPEHVRVIELAGRSLLVEDRVPGATVPFQSRLRLTAAGRAALSVEGSGAVVTREGEAWYEEHGEPRPATVLEQEAAPGGAIRWQVRF